MRPAPGLTPEEVEDRWPESRIYWVLWQALRQWVAALRRR